MSNYMNYKEFFTRFYHNNSGYYTQEDIKRNKKANKVYKDFHTCCPSTKKKKCFCKLIQSSQRESSLAEFIQKLYEGDYDIDISGKVIKVIENKPKEDYTAKEQMKITNYKQMKRFKRNINELSLTVNDYKDIEKSINEDKKVCEKCGANLFGENYHKGWKNESGDYVLLCYACSKKYFAGANEVKYETKRDGYSTTSDQRGYSTTHYQGTTPGMIPPFKTDLGMSQIHRNVNFKVTNTAIKP